ncbi:MAG TPA: TrkA family potassium uptake protein [Vicinamibacteria bacterium]|nr:TrkA family potassium uptake protein [Vicinamibacteria bacterium]
MFVLITGGGRTASALAQLLVGQKHEVHLVEGRPDVLTRLHRELPTEVIYQGSPIEIDTLERAGIARARVLATCLPRDADNLAISFVARARYRVPRIIACVNNPSNARLFNETFHVDVSLNQAEILATLIEEEMSLGDMMTLLKLRRGKYSLVEEKLPKGAPAIGVSLQDLPLPPNCVVSAIIRKGELILPRGGVSLNEGDEVLAIVETEAAEQLARWFNAPDRQKR